jgi:hypothetical protein
MILAGVGLIVLIPTGKTLWAMSKDELQSVHVAGFVREEEGLGVGLPRGQRLALDHSPWFWMALAASP